MYILFFIAHLRDKNHGDIYYLILIMSFCIAYFQRYRIHTFGGRELAVNMRGEDVSPQMNLLVR